MIAVNCRSGSVGPISISRLILHLHNYVDIEKLRIFFFQKRDTCKKLSESLKKTFRLTEFSTPRRRSLDTINQDFIVPSPGLSSTLQLYCKIRICTILYSYIKEPRAYKILLHII